MTGCMEQDGRSDGDAMVDQGQVAAVARELARYLVMNPKSKDTVKGMRWWLGSSSAFSEGAIRAAVRQLLARGWLVETAVPTGEPVFGLRAGSRRDLEEWLSSPSNGHGEGGHGGRG